MAYHQYVTVTKVKGNVMHSLPINATFTVRGARKGKNAKSGKCIACGEIIEIGEQYFRLEEGYCYCLGCVEYT